MRCTKTVQNAGRVAIFRDRVSKNCLFRAWTTGWSEAHVKKGDHVPMSEVWGNGCVVHFEALSSTAGSLASFSDSLVWKRACCCLRFLTVQGTRLQRTIPKQNYWRKISTSVIQPRMMHRDFADGPYLTFLGSTVNSCQTSEATL